MDTVYYNVNAKRVKVSGGPDLVRLEPVPVAAPAARPRETRVLDFDRCRRALETKAAWQRLEQAARESEDHAGEEQGAYTPLPRTQRASQWLELAASAAIIVMCVSAALAFLGLA